MMLQPYQCRTCSGLVHASNSSRRGTANTRVSTISRSEGNVSVIALFLASTSLLLCLQLGQVLVEAVKALLPEAAVALQPVHPVLPRRRFQPARPPLRLAAALDQPRPLQHLEMLRHRGAADLERLGELADRRLPQRQPREDGAPGGIGEGREGDAEAIRRHRLLTSGL